MPRSKCLKSSDMLAVRPDIALAEIDNYIKEKKAEIARFLEGKDRRLIVSFCEKGWW